MNFQEFLLWESDTSDTVDFKTTYVDMAGDLIAGLLLSQIVYWYLPSKTGGSKLRVRKKGYYWIVKRRTDWWAEVRLSMKQVDRALQVLRDAGLIQTIRAKFKGEPTTHIRLIEEAFCQRLSQVLQSPPLNPNLPKREVENADFGENHFTESDDSLLLDGDTPYTETQTEKQEKIGSKTEPSGPAGQLNLFMSDSKAVKLGNESDNTDEIDRAIAEVWETYSPGTIQRLRCTLLGQHPPNSKDFASNVKPPATAADIHEMGAFFRRECPEGKMPRVPEKIQDWLYRVRAMIPMSVAYKGHMIPLQLKVPPDRNTSQKALNYVKKYRPTEYDRIGYLFEQIDAAHPSNQQTDCETDERLYLGEIVEVPRSVPNDIGTRDDVIEYICVNYGPDEAKKLNNRLLEIEERRQRELEEILAINSSGVLLE